MYPAELLNFICMCEDNSGVELKAFLKLCSGLASQRSAVNHCGP